MAIAASYLEKVFAAEKDYMLVFSGRLPCQIYDTLRISRMLLHDALCQLTVELRQNPVVPFSALATDLPANLMDRYEVNRVLVLYVMKLVRQAVRQTYYIP